MNVDIKIEGNSSQETHIVTQNQESILRVAAVVNVEASLLPSDLTKYTCRLCIKSSLTIINISYRVYML